MSWREQLKELLRGVGVDVRRSINAPDYSLLGCRNLPIRAVLDVGANDGGFARYINRLFPQAKIYCFEPLREPRARLAQWLRNTPEVDALVVPVALGKTDHRTEIFVHEDHDSSSSILPTTDRATELFAFKRRQKREEIQVRSLDSWATENSFRSDGVVLLKLDVQGLEADVLQGGKETLRSVGICIVEVSIEPMYVGQSTFVELVSLLDESGLHYFGNLSQVNTSAGRPLYIDAMFLRDTLLE